MPSYWSTLTQPLLISLLRRLGSWRDCGGKEKRSKKTQICSCASRRHSEEAPTLARPSRDQRARSEPHFNTTSTMCQGSVNCAFTVTTDDQGAETIHFAMLIATLSICNPSNSRVSHQSRHRANIIFTYTQTDTNS